jgi:hypothetical protein
MVPLAGCRQSPPPVDSIRLITGGRPALFRHDVLMRFIRVYQVVMLVFFQLFSAAAVAA